MPAPSRPTTDPSRRIRQPSSDCVAWTAEETALLASLPTPAAVQEWLDDIPYNDEVTCRSPRRVMRDRRAHCMEGALFAAAALQFLGHPPLLVNLRAVRDDDHIIAPFRARGRLGALGKSNFTGLRYRAPVYRSLRELVLSYFEDNFNVYGEPTLRAYTRPLDLRTRRFGLWQTRADDLDGIGEHFDRMAALTIVTEEEAAHLRRVDPSLYRAGLLEANEKGLYR